MSNNDIELSYIMPVFFNQENCEVLIDLLRHYSSYQAEVLQKVEFVIIDDCSPIEVVIPEDIKLNYQLYRITDDITWNQAGARNLGIVYARSNKIILTDCDHQFPENLLKDIIKSKAPKRTLFKFKRVDTDGGKKNAPCNIFYTSKSVVFASLCYDEEFCGNYGYEDVMFREFQKRIGNSLTYFTRAKSIISTKIDRINSYHSLARKTEINYELMQRKLVDLKSSNPFKCHSRLFLNFNYQKVKEKLII